MKDVCFHDIILTRDDQRIVSADAWVYDVLGSYSVKPMNELIAIEDMDIYLKNIKNCDGNYYPSKILCPDTMYYTYMRAQSDNEKLIRLTVVNAHDLLNAHSSLMKTINTFKAQLDLYEDVFFEYNPIDNSVYVYNTELADFDAGTYSLSGFEKLLLDRCAKDQRHLVSGYITQVRSKVGRGTTIIDGNLLNDDTGVTHTVLDEAFVFYDKDTDGVVGHIHLRRGGGAIRTTAIRHDSLTGLVEKTDIIKIARDRIDGRNLEGTALVVIDVDYFKSINDNYGHQFGDEVIKKVADIISAEVGNSGIAGRFGGDEFFIVLYNIESEEELRSILKGIKNKVSATFPDKGIDKDNPLSVSIGAAVFPSGVDNYDDLFTLADHSLYLAKDKGRNRYIIYDPEKHGSLEDIKHKHLNSKKINERDISYGDVIVRMFDMALNREENNPEYYMREFAEAFDIKNMALYVGTPFVRRYSAGSNAVDDQAATDYTLSILNSESKEKYFSLGDFVVINRLEMLPPYARHIREFLEKRKIYSMIIIRFYDRDKRECVLIITSVGKRTQWNSIHFKYYRAFMHLLSIYSLG